MHLNSERFFTVPLEYAGNPLIYLNDFSLYLCAFRFICVLFALYAVHV